MARRKRSARALGLNDPDHAVQAQKSIDAAWVDLERMPPTCEGGVMLAARAYANAEKGMAHAWAITDRAKHEKMFGLGNRALKASWETLQFFALSCKAPHGVASERPLFSRRETAKGKRR